MALIDLDMDVLVSRKVLIDAFWLNIIDLALNICGNGAFSSDSSWIGYQRTC